MPAHPPTPAGLRVLLLEDSEDDALLIVRTLRGQFGDVRSTRVESVTALREALAGGSWDAAISDHTMPRLQLDRAAATLRESGFIGPLILCTGAPGILEDVNDPGSLVSYTDLGGLARLQAAGSFAAGMLPKATAIEDALRGGVRRVHVISYKVPDSLLAEIFTNAGTGTLVVEDINALTPAEQQAGDGL